MWRCETWMLWKEESQDLRVQQATAEVPEGWHPALLPLPQPHQSPWSISKVELGRSCSTGTSLQARGAKPATIDQKIGFSTRPSPPTELSKSQIFWQVNKWNLKCLKIITVRTEPLVLQNALWSELTLRHKTLHGPLTFVNECTQKFRDEEVLNSLKCS